MHNRWTCKDNFWFRLSKFVLLYSPPPQRQLICVTGKIFLITAPSDQGNRTHAFYERLIVSFGYFVLLSILIKGPWFPPSSFWAAILKVNLLGKKFKIISGKPFIASQPTENKMCQVAIKAALCAYFSLWAGPINPNNILSSWLSSLGRKRKGSESLEPFLQH